MCVDDTSGRLPSGGFSGLLSSSPLLSTHLLACSGDCIRGSLASGFWLEQTEAAISKRPESRRRVNQVIYSLDFLPAGSLWVDSVPFSGGLCQTHLCLQFSVTALSTHPFRPVGFMCCGGNNQWYLDLFSQFSLIIRLLFLNYNSVIHWKLSIYLLFRILQEK